MTDKRAQALQGFAEAITEMQPGSRIVYRGVTVECAHPSYQGYTYRVGSGRGGLGGSLRSVAAAARDALAESAASRAWDALGGPVDYSPNRIEWKRIHKATERGSERAHFDRTRKACNEHAITRALENETDASHEVKDLTAQRTAEQEQERQWRNEHARSARAKQTPAERKARRRVQMRQIGGDDGYHWHVIVDGRSVYIGCTHGEAEYYRTREIARLLGVA